MGTDRKHNLALLMRLICAGGPVTRVELARRAGLSTVAVTNLVTELIEAGVVADLGAVPASGPGRPAGRVAAAHEGPVGLGLCFDVDYVAGYVVDLRGRPRHRELRRATLAGTEPAEAVRAARPVLRRLFEQAVTTDRLVAGVAVAVEGVIEHDRDGYPTVHRAPSLGWRDADLRALVERELAALGAHGVPVQIGGGAGYAAAAEDVEEGSALYVGGEAELGAVLVSAGAAHRGAAGAAGLLGHVPVRHRGRSCPCGLRGCLDAYAGRRAMAAAVGVGEGAVNRLLTGEDPFGRRLRAGQEAAAAAAELAAHRLADALAGPLAVLDPEVVVLGGRLAALGEPFAGPLRRRLADHHPWTLLRPGRRGPDAVLLGAARGALAEVLADPVGWADRAP
ncbi:ROK family transcriptional regulator [Amycolatopsis aidingensis]|uniref:ROK family transcriptional regulator n=1 Tax=Amycolatopsis aidingensis TaxID=2842453 RepID=UPI001C0DEA3E|nr:ROK family protein [Amycolatopsis aidingensis]